MQIEVQEHGETYVLCAALLLYAKKSGYTSDSGSFATVHQVANDRGTPIIKPGRPMHEQDYAEMLKALAPVQRPQMEWLDRSILARGLGKMIWWTPAMNRPMFFKESNHVAKTFNGQGVCPVPAMVWMATERTLYVYALDVSTAPEQETQLCQAPLFNVWPSGEVCHGTAVVPSDDQKGNPKEWEKFLFGSHFTHPNFTEKDRLVKGIDPGTFWKNQVDRPTAKFPTSRLVPVPFKVADLLEPDFVSKAEKLRARGQF